MESILSHNIVDIRHRPGIENPVTDGLSRMWRNRKRSQTDGSTWSVLPDWEASKGIQNDIMAVSDSPNPSEHPLETKFKGDIFFAPIVKHLLGRSTGDSATERRKAMHRAEGFLLEGNKLWRVSSKTGDRVPRTECIPTTAGFQLALDAHKAILNALIAKALARPNSMHSSNLSGESNCSTSQRVTMYPFLQGKAASRH